MTTGNYWAKFSFVWLLQGFIQAQKLEHITRLKVPSGSKTNNKRYYKTLTFHILYSVKPPVIKVHTLKCGGMMLRNLEKRESQHMQ